MPKRLYGRRWGKARRAHLARHPLCVMCQRDGRTVAADVVDHITPHRDDPVLFWDPENWQSLCKRHHDIKTATEDGGFRVQYHPDWLPKPACPVTIVCGPAGGGKTTWAREQAGRKDEVIDLDDCFHAVCGVHGHQADRKHLPAAVRVRNKLLAGLAAKRDGSAFLIVSAPTQAERDWWAKTLSADVVVIAPPLGEIEARPISDRRKRLAARWFREEALNEWAPPKSRKLREVGLDGYPVKG